ncbi:TetR/AcrR family transcriptional regulator [Tessaracoccus sp. ZS01]|uniref:TetR/AcrR family transcriptional regulator n=1 Tax=Tessaracoccus sp. ZS01 TaxID=1906324 RepID=UPI00096DC466|nr:TetR family transcriptional regulator [Tessaracoccus sp. ZS01]MCG6567744.1 TetR family transcriptional regulator [Tessaracoccus sp. ZS01]OMG55490.1 TetR family transcriptional regulator [Tessaracoccus sp. ZS01]
MPKIAAASVAEHRAQVEVKLLDAAEALLRAGLPLTAGKVTQDAGIARNSIYRYVDSIDDLRGMVVARYLPLWSKTVGDAVAEVSDPGDQVVAWVRANLEEAASTGHGWLMQMAQQPGASRVTSAIADQAHDVLRASLIRAWRALLTDPDLMRLNVALTRGILQAAFVQLDRGFPPEKLIPSVVDAARALVDAATGTAARVN